MRYVLPIILFALYSLRISAQDYRLINPSKEAHFNNSNILSIRIDSIFVSGNDTTFFNHKIFSLDYNNYPCEGFITDTSWIGKDITSQSNGDWIFRNFQYEPVLVKSKASLNDTWIFYSFSNSNYVEAKVTSITQQMVLGNQDSVKIITLQVKNASNINIAHAINGKQIKLSKNNGIIELFVFSDFPNNLNTYTIIGLSNPDNGIVNLKAASIFDYMIGDEFHYQEDYQEPFSWFFTFYRRILKVLDKNVSVNLDTLNYTFERCQMKIQNTSFTVYNPDTTYIFDTISSKIIISQYSYLNKLTFEPIYNVYTLTGMAGYVNFTTNYSHFRRQKELSTFWEYVSDTCFQGFIDGSSRVYTYIDGLGGGFYDDYNNNNRFIVVYYKKGAETWGTPLTCNSTLTGINRPPIKKVNVKVSPNPFSDYTTIKIDDFDTSEELSFKLFNSLGKEISTFKMIDNTFTLQKNNLSSGIYFYQIFDDNHQINSTGKIIIK